MATYDTYLDRVMAERGLENHELAGAVGTSRQAIYKLRKGITRMLPHWAKRLAPHLALPWQELVEGAPMSMDTDLATLVTAYEAMDDEQRQALLAVAKVISRGDEADGQRARRPAASKAVACVLPIAVKTERQRG